MVIASLIGGIEAAPAPAVGGQLLPPSGLTVDAGMADPLGFHDPAPGFTWRLPDLTNSQEFYQIELSSAGGVLWDSGWTESDQSSFVAYQGPALTSRQQAQWRVRVRDDKGNESAWSEPGRIEMGLLTADDWKARWIRPAGEMPAGREPVAFMRRSFQAAKPMSKARLYVTARGGGEASLNGMRVGSDYLAPGWTSYYKRLDTLTYDVTGQLLTGQNYLQVLLGTGWYAGRLTTQADVKKMPDARIRSRNSLAEQVMRESQIPITDLYSISVGHPEHHSDNVHFNGTGINHQADQVVEGIKKQLQNL
ncbi:MAG: alpha-L-rhamnosidase N-terminal domain-containing protein [Verrucomicrobiota bacterium]